MCQEFYALPVKYRVCTAEFLDNPLQEQNPKPFPGFGLPSYAFPVVKQSLEIGREWIHAGLSRHGSSPAGMETRRCVKSLNLIGSFLAKKRHELGWSQEKMAARLQREGVDVSRQMLANMESGRTQITDNFLVGCQKVFRMPIIRLFPLVVQDSDAHFAQREKDQLDGPRRRRQ